MKKKKFSSEKKIRFITALDIIKYLIQIQLPEIAPYVRSSELPSNTGTIVPWGLRCGRLNCEGRTTGGRRLSSEVLFPNTEL